MTRSRSSSRIAAILATYLLLALKANGFSCSKRLIKKPHDSIFSSQRIQVHNHGGSDDKRHVLSFPARISSFKNRLYMQLSNKIKRVRLIFLALCIAFCSSKSFTSVFPATNAVSHKSSISATGGDRTVKQEKERKISDVSAVIIAALLGSILGKNIIIRKKPSDVDEGIRGTTQEYHAMFDTANATSLLTAKPLENYSPSQDEDENDFQRKRRVAANRRVRELLATNNQKPTVRSEIQSESSESSAASLAPSSAAPMSGWAGYKHERWGGYLDKLNVNKSPSQDILSTSSSSTMSYLEGLSKSMPVSSSKAFLVDTETERDILTLDQSDTLIHNSKDATSAVPSEAPDTATDSDIQGGHDISSVQHIDESAHESKVIEHGDNSLQESKAAKYAAIADIGERAFTILVDLGIVRVTPDIDDPSYDHSVDYELAPENVFR